MTATVHRTGTREEWLAARLALLEREKELTRRSDELVRERQALPWVRIDKPYAFETPGGTKTLAELFDGRSQLLVYHFMFGPGWDAGCPSCSSLADHVDRPRVHLEHHDVTLTCVSRAPLATLETYRARMGWTVPWVSSGPSDFNADFGVSFEPEVAANGVDYNFRHMDADPRYLADELPGMSAFALEDGVVHHTYSAFDRGTDVLNGAWQLLDRAPFGRFRTPSEEESSGAWPRRKDEYATAGAES